MHPGACGGCRLGHCASAAGGRRGARARLHPLKLHAVLHHSAISSTVADKFIRRQPFFLEVIRAFSQNKVSLSLEEGGGKRGLPSTEGLGIYARQVQYACTTKDLSNHTLSDRDVRVLVFCLMPCSRSRDSGSWHRLPDASSNVGMCIDSAYWYTSLRRYLLVHDSWLACRE